MSRQLDRVRRNIRPSEEGLDLYAWQDQDVVRHPRLGSDHDLSDWRVIDDWPRPVPVTTEEIDVFEAWFGDILDELFGHCDAPGKMSRRSASWIAGLIRAGKDARYSIRIEGRG